MGANPTQAQAFLLFLIAFIFLACTFATGSLIYLVAFLACLGGSLGLFVKCKPWEHRED